MVGAVANKSNQSAVQGLITHGLQKQEGVKGECQTCKNRRYVDSSNDSGVSFKAPGYISPESSGAVVAAHEYEHVTNSTLKASQSGKKVVSQNVQLFTGVCPECGRVYVAGGKTTTVTASSSKSEYDKSIGKGRNVDMRA